jgi:hypothetical protein
MPGWCIRWALDMIHGGQDRWVMEELCKALSSCEEDFEAAYELYETLKKAGFDKDDQIEEVQLLEQAVDAARKWHEKRESNLEKQRASRSKLEASNAN